MPPSGSNLSRQKPPKREKPAASDDTMSDIQRHTISMKALPAPLQPRKPGDSSFKGQKPPERRPGDSRSGSSSKRSFKPGEKPLPVAKLLEDARQDMAEDPASEFVIDPGVDRIRSTGPTPIRASKPLPWTYWAALAGGLVLGLILLLVVIFSN